VGHVLGGKNVFRLALHQHNRYRWIHRSVYSVTLRYLVFSFLPW